MFKNLQEYRIYLENDTSISYDESIVKTLILLRDKSKTEEMTTQLLYEQYFHDFKIVNGLVESKYGKPHDYPNYNLFGDDLKYIKERALSTQNPKYKAKYYNLLWDSKEKHIDYAKQAIDNYFDFLNENTSPMVDRKSNSTWNDYFKNLFCLSKNINYRKEEIIHFFMSILETNIINERHKYIIINFLVKEGKVNNINYLNSFMNYSNKVINDSDYRNLEQEYLELLIVLSQKLNISTKLYHNTLAEFYIKESEKWKGSFVAHNFFFKALTHFKDASNTKRIEEVTLLMEKAKTQLGFEHIPLELQNDTLNNCLNSIDNTTDILVDTKTSKEIFDYIVKSDKIFPEAEDVKVITSPILATLTCVTIFDQNNNITNKKNISFNSYFTHLNIFSIFHLKMIIIKGLKNRKITFINLIEYLRKHSWMGTQNDIKYDWIGLMSPALHHYFAQLEIDINQSNSNTHNYILPIDSLVIKFEGLLREYSRIIGAQTIELKENRTEERISFEKLFNNPIFIDCVPKNDLAFFKYLFTSEGINLRNNIAHCFYNTNNYSSDIILLVITAVLKLGSYKYHAKK
jgi:hypothetical protein